MNNLEMNKELVRRFYRDLWDNQDLEEMPSILHENLTFRGSLGQEKKGHGGFAEYVEQVHNGLDEYRCIEKLMVAEGVNVMARMLFTGIHNHPFMGYPPTYKRISWQGCAVFTILDGLISDVWVMGDLKGLESQLQD